MLPLSGHNYETGCNDWYRGSDYEPVGTICEKIWLFASLWWWIYEVSLNPLIANMETTILYWEVLTTLAITSCTNIEIFSNHSWICFPRHLFRFQPVYVIDVAAAIMAALKDDGASMGKVYELGGPEIFTVHELVISGPLFSSCYNMEWIFTDSKCTSGSANVWHDPWMASLCESAFPNCKGKTNMLLLSFFPLPFSFGCWSGWWLEIIGQWVYLNLF